MLCKYCNALLKTEDRTCPICGKPVDGIGNVVNQNVVNVPNDITNIPEDVMAGLDKSIFEPLQSQESNVVQQSVISEEPQIIEEQPMLGAEVSPMFADQPIVLEEPQSDNTYSSVQPPLVENVITNIPDNSNFTGTKKTKNNMLMVLIISVIFVAVILGFMLYVSRSPKMIFNSLINKTYKQINNNIITDINNIKGSMSLQTNILSSDETSNEIFEILNNIYLGADYEIDYENKIALVKLNTKYDNEKLLDAEVYLKDNKGYILLKDAYSKYLSTDVDDFDSMFEQVEIIGDHKIVLSEVKKAITKSLKSDYFTKEKVDIKLNDETESVTKNSLVLNEEVAEKIKKDTLTYLMGNDRFVASLSNIAETSKDEILTSIEDELKLLDSNTTYVSDTEITISIYTNGLMNDVVKMDLVVVSEDEKTTIEFTEEADNNYSIVLNNAGSTINGSIKLLEDNDETNKVEVSFTEPTSATTIGLTIGMSVKYNTQLTNVDVSNSVDANSLTEEEVNEIMTKLLENKGIKDIVSAFEGISYSDSNDDNEYYYDGTYNYYDELMY